MLIKTLFFFCFNTDAVICSWKILRMMTRRAKKAVETFGMPFMLVFNCAIVIGANNFGLDSSKKRLHLYTRLELYVNFV